MDNAANVDEGVAVAAGSGSGSRSGSTRKQRPVDLNSERDEDIAEVEEDEKEERPDRTFGGTEGRSARKFEKPSVGSSQSVQESRRKGQTSAQVKGRIQQKRVEKRMESEEEEENIGRGDKVNSRTTPLPPPSPSRHLTATSTTPVQVDSISVDAPVPTTAQQPNNITGEPSSPASSTLGPRVYAPFNITALLQAAAAMQSRSNAGTPPPPLTLIPTSSTSAPAVTSLARESSTVLDDPHEASQLFRRIKASLGLTGETQLGASSEGPDPSAEEQPRRARGRPRKHPKKATSEGLDPNGEEKPRRGRGRPKKVREEKPRRGRGRPRIHPKKAASEEPDPNSEEKPRRGPGRPKKHQQQPKASLKGLDLGIRKLPRLKLSQSKKRRQEATSEGSDSGAEEQLQRGHGWREEQQEKSQSMPWRSEIHEIERLERLSHKPLKIRLEEKARVVARREPDVAAMQRQQFQFRERNPYRSVDYIRKYSIEPSLFLAFNIFSHALYIMQFLLNASVPFIYRCFL